MSKMRVSLLTRGGPPVRYESLEFPLFIPVSLIQYFLADFMIAPIPNSYWVVSGCFAAGEYPGAMDPVETTKLGTLLDAGIDNFIDLTELGELVAYSGIVEREARRRGLTVECERYPIRDMSVPRSPEEMTSILDAIDDALDDGRTVFVHCWGGIGRTGTVVGCWLVRHGSSGDEALDRVGELFKGMEKAPYRSGSPETPQQEAYVRNWTELVPKE